LLESLLLSAAQTEDRHKTMTMMGMMNGFMFWIVSQAREITKGQCGIFVKDSSDIFY
jgi:hypothetical protein